jgi:hypothetical protein
VVNVFDASFSSIPNETFSPALVGFRFLPDHRLEEEGDRIRVEDLREAGVRRLEAVADNHQAGLQNLVSCLSSPRILSIHQTVHAAQNGKKESGKTT